MPKEVRKRRIYSAPQLKCPYINCPRWCRNSSGLRKHVRYQHILRDGLENPAPVNSEESEDIEQQSDGDSNNPWPADNLNELPDAQDDMEDINGESNLIDRENSQDYNAEMRENEEVERHTDTEEAIFRNERVYHPVMTGTSFLLFLDSLHSVFNLLP